MDPDLHYLCVAQHNLLDLVAAENTNITILNNCRGKDNCVPGMTTIDIYLTVVA